MKRAAFISILLLGFAAADCGAVANRAVSLKVLQSVVRAGQAQQASNLCGITYLTGYVVDKSGRDIILTGKVDPSLPALSLDDFVVALRNARMVYTRRVGRVRYYESPGCSIDPNPDTLRELESVGNRLSLEADQNEREQVSSEYEAVGARPQKVRVMGVPFDSRFAKVMVDADYYMKRLVNGSVDLGIPGLESLWDLRLKVFQAETRSGNRSRMRSLNRFWFCPGKTTFEEQDDAVVLRDAQVMLRTEEEFLADNGRVTGMGRPDPSAAKFAESFSANYRAIAKARPVYHQLQGLFRSVAIGKLIHGNQALTQARLNLDYLLRDYRVRSVGVSRAVKGLTRIEELTDEYEDGGYVVRATSTLMTCGGVSMDVKPVKIPAVTVPQRQPAKQRAAARSGKAKPGVMHKVVAARKTKNALYWDYGASD